MKKGPEKNPEIVTVPFSITINWAILNSPEGNLRRINDQVYFIIDQEIFPTDDGGETWTVIKTVNRDETHCFANSAVVLSVAYDFMNRENVLEKTNNGCKSLIFITPEVFTSKSVR